MTFTKEQLQEIIDTDHVQCGEASALARMALAGMEAEPVAWQWEYRDKCHVTNDPARAKFVAEDGDVTVNPLYAAPQPATVVPDELTREEYKRRFMEEDNFDDTFIGGWAAFRAAMLQAGNSPVIPDGLRLALSNAGIAAPESDELLFATHGKYIQMLVTWVKDRKPFQSAEPQQEVKP